MKTELNGKGKYHGIYIPTVLDEKIEETRKRLGMNRSRFIQYCVLKVLQELSVLTTTIHEPQKN